MNQPALKPWPADKVTRRSVAELAPYARNARLHSDAQVAQIAASIGEWGWTMPVLLDEAGGIIAGHGRVLAAKKLGIDAVPCMAVPAARAAGKCSPSGCPACRSAAGACPPWEPSHELEQPAGRRKGRRRGDRRRTWRRPRPRRARHRLADSRPRTAPPARLSVPDMACRSFPQALSLTS